MAYRPLLRTIDQTTGSNVGTWGDNIDDTFTILEEAIAGETAISTTGGDTTLTTADNATDQQRKMIIRVTGTLASNANIIVPSTTKTYDVINATSGAYTVTIKVSGQTGVAVPQGGAVRVAVTSAGDCEMIARRDPTNDFEAADRTKLDGIASGAQVNVGTDLTYTAGTRTLNSSTGANVVLPVADSTNAGLAPVFSASDALKVLRVSASGGPEFATVSVGGGDMFIANYDPGSVAEQLVGITATQTLTNKTLGATTVTGKLTLSPSGNAILVQEGGGTGVSADSVADNIVIDSTGNAGMTILTGDSSEGAVFFGRASGTQVSRGGMKYNFSDDHLYFESGGADALYIKSGGNVGIGESSPQNLLHLSSAEPYIRIEDSDGVLGGAVSAGMLAYAQGNLQSAIGHIGASDGMLKVANYQGDVRIESDANNLKPQSGIEFYVDGSRRLIQAESNLRSEESTLTLASSAGEDGTRLVFEKAGNTLGWIGIPDWNQDALYVYGPDSAGTAAEVAALYTQDSWSFRTGGTERFYIDSSGRLGIGTSSIASGARVHIDGNGSPATLLVEDASDPVIALTDGSTGMRLSYEETAQSLRIQKTDGSGVFVSEVAWFNADGEIRFNEYSDGFLRASSSGYLSTARTGWVLHSNVATTSGATVDFTSIPSGIRRVRVVLESVSGADSSQFIGVRFGTPTIATSGYNGSAQDSSGVETSTDRFRLSQSLSASSTASGIHEWERIGSTNTWVHSGQTIVDGGGMWNCGGVLGSASLGGALSTLRILWSGATTFDAGSASLYYDYGE